MVPEPSAYGAALLGVGVGVVCWIRGKTRRRVVERACAWAEPE